MKKRYLLFIFLIVQKSFCFGMIAYEINTLVSLGNISQLIPVYNVAGQRSYITGGVTFIYPDTLFDYPPVIRISVQPNSEHSNSITYTTEISANSMTSAIVKAYKVDTSLPTTTITEAATDEVTIHFFATGI